VRAELGFERGSVHARLDERGPRNGVDLEYTVQSTEIAADHGSVVVGWGFDTANDRRTPSVGDDHRIDP
jgi:hypothetical protein